MAEPAHLSREEIAKREIGVTAISRTTSIWIVGAFLFTITIIPAIQLGMEWRAQAAGERTEGPGVFSFMSAFPESWAVFNNPANGSLWDRVFAANAVLLQHINDYEKQLEDDSFVATASIPAMQAITSRFLGLGNEQVYLGRDRWLFYRPGVDYLTGQPFLSERRLRARALAGSEWSTPVQPDPRPAIIDFKNQLAARGITLVLVPTPVKAVIQPARFSSYYRKVAQPIKNPSYDQWIADLKAAGVLVFDPSDLLLQRLRESGTDQFLETDTHWRPEAMEAVAGELAKFLRAQVEMPPADAQFRIENATAEEMGDIAVMLKLPATQTLYRPQSVPLKVVLSPTGEVWRPTRAGEVLLLGDSFSNIYSLGAMNWGESAGFAEHLSAALGLRADAILRNDAGAYASREILARELAKGDDRLAGKRVVIWQFAARELAVGDWKMLSLAVGEPKPKTFFVPEDGVEGVTVQGTIVSASPIPRPGSVPYKDHIFSVHLSDITGPGVPAGSEAVVYLRSMADGVLTDAAKFRSGDSVTLRISSWNDVAEKYDRFNRSEPDDESLQLESPAWGEPVK